MREILDDGLASPWVWVGLVVLLGLLWIVFRVLFRLHYATVEREHLEMSRWRWPAWWIPPIFALAVVLLIVVAATVFRTPGHGDDAPGVTAAVDRVATQLESLRKTVQHGDPDPLGRPFWLIPPEPQPDDTDETSRVVAAIESLSDQVGSLDRAAPPVFGGGPGSPLSDHGQ